MAKTNQLELIKAFIQEHSSDAARILESHEMNEVAELLTVVTTKSYTPDILKNISLQSSSRICENIDEDIAVKLLSLLNEREITNILRRVNSEKRFIILEKLPLRQKQKCSYYLKYSSKLVGAWMDPHATSIPHHYSIKEARRIILKEHHVDDNGLVFILDNNGEVDGVIHVASIFLLDDDEILDSIIKPAQTPVRSSEKLVNIENNVGWNYSDIIPVIDNKKSFIGAISHMNLRNGLNYSTYASEPIYNNEGDGICKAYSNTFFTLIDTFSELAKNGSSNIG